MDNNNMQIAGYLQNLNPQQLMNALKQPPPGVPLYLVMTEQLRRQNIQKQAAATPQGPAPTTTVAQDMMQAGIAGTPEMSLGGQAAPVGLGSLQGDENPPQEATKGYAYGGEVDSDDENEWYQFGPKTKYPSGPGIANEDYSGFKEYADKQGFTGAYNAISDTAQNIGNYLGDRVGELKDGVKNLRNSMNAPRDSRQMFEDAYVQDLYNGPRGSQSFPLNPPPQVKYDHQIAEQPVAAMPASPEAQSEAIAPTMPSNRTAVRSFAPPMDVGGLASLKQGGLRTDYNPPQQPDAPALEQFIGIVSQYNPDVLTPKMLERLEKKEKALEEARAQSGNMALITAGLSIMAGHDKGMRAIARGGLAGLAQYGATNEQINKRQDDYDEIRMKLAEREQQRQQSNMMAANSMRNSEISHQNSRYNNEQENYRLGKTLEQQDRQFGFNVDKEENDRAMERARLNQSAYQHADTIGLQRERLKAVDKATKEEKEFAALKRRYDQQVKERTVLLSKDPMAAFHPDELYLKAQTAVMENGRFSPAEKAKLSEYLGIDSPKTTDSAPQQSQQQILNDARRALQLNPGKKDEINRRLQAAGLPTL